MNPDDPIVMSQQPLSRDMAVQGLQFIEEQLGLTSTISTRHPLCRIYAEASKHLSTGITWGPSRKFNLLALWGIQLWMIRNWDGFDDLTHRIKSELQDWDAHLHEARVASMFWLAGCDGEFLEPGTQGGPDLRISYAGHEALVECKRSRALTEQEEKNRGVWYPATSQIVHYLNTQVPSAFVGFRSSREALADDSELLLRGVQQKVASWKEYQASHPSNRWGYSDLRASDNSFTGRIVVGDAPDQVFDAAAANHPGIEVPDETEPISLILDLTLSSPPTCDGLWYAKIHAKRAWTKVERGVLRRHSDKANQLDNYRQVNHQAVTLPGIVWIHHPAFRDASNADLIRLHHRISGRFTNDRRNQYTAVAAVILTDSRLLLSKYGQLVPQFRISFVANSQALPLMYEKFPYVTWNWWNEAETKGLPAQEVMGKRMWLGSTDSRGEIRGYKPE